MIDSRGRGIDQRAALAAAFAVLAVIAAIYCVCPVWRAAFPLEISVDYPSHDALITNNYPPLSFYLIGALTKLGADATTIGRTLSLVAVVATAAATAIAIRELGGEPIASALGGLWLIVVLARFFDGYVGVNDPHLPATALMTIALAWLLALRRRSRAAEPAVVLMVAAGFYKPTLIATPLAALLWVIGIDRRRGIRAALLGATVATVGLFVCLAVFGTNFLDQLLFARHYSPRRIIDMAGRLQWIAPALIVWAIWSWFAPPSEAKRFTQLYMGAALAAFLLQSAGAGVGNNSQFELVVASAIGLGLAFDGAADLFASPRNAERARLAIVAVLIIRLLASTRIEPYLVLASPEYRSRFAEHAAVMRQEIDRVRAIPGPVACRIAAVCRFAGKPFVLDRFALAQRIKAGRMTAEEAEVRVRAAGIRDEPIDPRASAESLARRH
jgi:uncharacterized protein YqgC (DUF456 family)